MKTSQEPLILSIRCITYNHEPFIRQCLEGFVMQKTNFRFEAIVHDDASTDGTADIVREYAAKYPDIIKPILETENQYSKRNGSIGRIMDAACKGKYIALCEGDDYWTDPNKLQKQVDFLESHPDYAMCFHNAIIHYEEGDIEDRIFANVENREYRIQELYTKWYSPTASLVLRRSVYDSELHKKFRASKKLVSGDMQLVISTSYCGKMFGFSDVMSVYRVHKGGVSQAFGKVHTALFNHYIEMLHILPKELRPYEKRSVANFFILGFRDAFRHKPNRDLILVWKAFKTAPTYCLKALAHWSKIWIIAGFEKLLKRH